MKSSKILLGVMAGFATGAAVGILFAPKKGSKTRKLIVRTSEDYADAVKEKVNSLMEGINEQCASFCKEAEIMIATGKIKFQEAKNEIEQEEV
jgi:gas vesicle protein